MHNHMQCFICHYMHHWAFLNIINPDETSRNASWWFFLGNNMGKCHLLRERNESTSLLWHALHQYPWNKTLSCFSRSVLAKGHSRHFSSLGVKVHYHLESMHCLGHAVQWDLLRAPLNCCRSFGKSPLKTEDGRSSSFFSPLPTYFLPCGLLQALLLKVCTHCTTAVSGSCSHWKKDLDPCQWQREGGERWD